MIWNIFSMHRVETDNKELVISVCVNIFLLVMQSFLCRIVLQLSAKNYLDKKYLDEPLYKNSFCFPMVKKNTWVHRNNV